LFLRTMTLQVEASTVYQLIQIMLAELDLLDDPPSFSPCWFFRLPLFSKVPQRQA